MFSRVVDKTCYFWNSLFEGMDFGWHTIEDEHLALVVQKLKKHIDDLVAIEATAKLKREVRYGDQKIKLSPSSEAHSEAITLIALYNAILDSDRQIHVLLMPEYDSIHDLIFTSLMRSQATISIDALTHQFGDGVTTVVTDFKKLGLIEIDDNNIRLTDLTMQISILNEQKGSANI